MTTKPQKRKYHHGDLRTKALEQAAKSVAKRGLDGLGLRSLAKEIGVSHAAVNYHFRDRQVLLDAIAFQGFEILGRSFHAASELDNPKARLRAFGHAYVNFAVENSGHFRVMFGNELLAGPISEKLRTSSTNSFNELFNILDKKEDALFCWGMVHGLANLKIYNLLHVNLKTTDTEIDTLISKAIDKSINAVFDE